MKKLLTLLLPGILLLCLRNVQGQIPLPDLSFGTNGIVVTDIDGENDVANDMVMQPDGKYLVAGNGLVQSHNQFMIIRYLSNGVIDSTFGINGKATVTLSPFHNYARAIALQQDGKIVVAGYFDFNFEDRAVVVRFNGSGTLDTTFGIAGIVQFSVTTDIDGFNDVVVLNDGKILVAGRKYSNNSYNFYIRKLNSNGTTDMSFGNNGKVETDFQGNQDFIYSMLIQPDNKILAAGASGPSASYFAAARYHANGMLDTTFGTGGKVIIGSGSRLDFCTGLALYPDGSVMMGGNHHNNQVDEYMFVKLDATGLPDASFGTNGVQYLPTAHPTNLIRTIVLQQDGKIIAAGSGLGNQAVIMRLNTNGTADNSFGVQGIFACGGSVSGSQINSLLLLGDTAIAACGFSHEGITDDYIITKVLMPATTGLPGMNDSDKSITIYPNPASDYIYIDAGENENPEIIISMYDFTGRLVFHKKVAGGLMPLRIQVPEGLNSGSYLMQIQNDNKLSAQKIFIR